MRTSYRPNGLRTLTLYRLTILLLLSVLSALAVAYRNQASELNLVRNGAEELQVQLRQTEATEPIWENCEAINKLQFEADEREAALRQSQAKPRRIKTVAGSAGRISSHITIMTMEDPTGTKTHRH